MEKKTIGTLIAALRRSSGMTQKQLADKLNVSDKSVSRWERDECAPDLALIPVIGEIFGVTADELIRGERRNPEDLPQHDNKKTEKQLRRLLGDALMKLRIRSIVAVMVALLGQIAAMICNLGFQRAYLGFFIGSAYLLVAAVMESVYLLQNYHAVEDSDLEENPMMDYRRKVVKLACTSGGVLFVLFAIMLPLIVIPWNAYLGLDGGSWLGYGLVYGGIGVFISLLAGWLAARILEKRGFLEEEAMAVARNRLRIRMMKNGAVILIVTLVCNWVFSQFTDASTFVEGITFEDWESFKAYMETPMDYDGVGMIAVQGDGDDIVYITESGSFIYPDDVMEDTVVTRHGMVLCSYKILNLAVAETHYGPVENDLLPVTVYTYNQRVQGSTVKENIQIVFFIMYILEILGLGIWYKFQSRKL